MKTTKHRRNLMLLTGALTVLALAGCSSKPLQSYTGEPRSLENVAVIITGQDTCPVFCIDDQFRAPDNQDGREFHVLPGAHKVDVFRRRQGAFDAWYVDQVPVNSNFQAGHVYAIKKSQATDDPVELAKIEWSPYVQDLGSVVDYAQAHSKYGSSSPAWKQLRQDHGMTKSLWAFLKPNKKDQTQAQAQDGKAAKKSFWAFLKRDKNAAEPENIAD